MDGIDHPLKHCPERLVTEGMDAELFCGHHVTLVAWPESWFTVCPWCPVREVRAIVAIDGRTV